MKRLLSLSVLVFSLGAFAQTTSLLPQLSFHRVDDPTVDTFTFGAAQCNDTITVRWSNTLTINLTQCTQNPLKVWATKGECLDTGPGVDDVRYDDIAALTVQQLRQGTFTVKIAELPGFNASATDGGLTVCGSPNESTTQRICGRMDYGILSGGFGGCTTNPLNATPLKLVYDTKAPVAPTITQYGALDQGVRIGFTAPSDASTVTVEAKGPNDADYRQLAETASTNTQIQGKGLQNATTYDVRLRSIDAAGNVSDPSSSVSVTPIKTLGFYGFYKQSGGTDAGCSTGLGLVPALVALFALRRRARKQSRSNT
jgi:hypothetical protein